MSSWPKVDGIDDDFYPSTTKDSKSSQNAEEIIISSPNELMDTSITNTFPENRMVRTPNPNEFASSHTPQLPGESLMVAMIEEQLLMSQGGKYQFPTNNDNDDNKKKERDFHDPRSPNAKLSMSTRDRYYSDDVLALNPELMDTNQDRKPSDDIITVSSKTSEQVINQYSNNNNKKLSTSIVTATTKGRFHTTTVKASPRSNDKNGPYVEMTEMDEVDIDGNDENENDNGNVSETTMSSKSETNLKINEEDKDAPINQRTSKSVVTDGETIGTIRKSDDKDEIRTASIFSGDHIGNIAVSNMDLINTQKIMNDIDNNDTDLDIHGKEEVDDQKYIFSAASLQSPRAPFDAEMLNPVNVIPTTVPSIFSPTSNYQ
eukprot:CAMPEP_0201569444 /NCGR_PEP_ID=MMETSP0190_2-20130828/11103_1 /ASSEMBLY_ACC=CAM_ASM_000263 /TAXON_ID=37353 /ORGANISM="Rosalina sp." /LENGTH=373 /DNA_ID=CAMNT_0047991735 /DNA_START=1261 /DNA_END=2382 /DNA_ORIENTATION=+